MKFLSSINLFIVFLGVNGDPTFKCTDKETGDIEIKDYQGYVECSRTCTCEVFELMCLEASIEVEYQDRTDGVVSTKTKWDNYELHHRSITHANDVDKCQSPQCICNTSDNYAEFSPFLLDQITTLGEPAYVPVEDHLTLTLNAAPGSYEAYLAKQFVQPSDDGRYFAHPFKEETEGQDLLRRVQFSDNKDWSTFIEGCKSTTRLLQDETTADPLIAIEDDIVIDVEVIPADTLVCDLHYEKNWNMRRRYTKSCSDVNQYTLPCSGTFACLCKQNDKEFYRLSKTMPVVPEDYKGLKTTLADVWIPPPVVTEDDSNDAWINIAIYAAIGVGGGIILCFGCYYLAVCWAKRSHKVTYLDKKSAAEREFDRHNGVVEQELPHKSPERTSSKLSNQQLDQEVGNEHDTIEKVDQQTERTKPEVDPTGAPTSDAHSSRVAQQQEDDSLVGKKAMERVESYADVAHVKQERNF